mmetsp:Transcript_71770/g.140782  ORF Transcript_71770/g.140782 Transcript_71770/m.140782 type:complete len:202 (+) Transcript_71770:456-1061(+)
MEDLRRQGFLRELLCPSWSEVVVVLTVGANGASLSILAKHMARMESGWLYVETVNAFLYLLREREALLCRLDTTRTSNCFYNSYFFEKLLGTVNEGHNDYGGVSRWSNRVPAGGIFLIKALYIPILLPGHWALVVADIQGRRTHYYDSLLAESSDRGLKYGEATKKYLADVALKCALAISSETLDIASWEIVLGNAADVPE